MRYAKRRRRYNYGKINKRPAKKGIAGFTMAIVGLALLALFLVMSAESAGNLEPIMGALTFVLFGLGALGLWISIQSFHEIDRSYTISKIAIWVNAALMFIIFIIYILGLR